MEAPLRRLEDQVGGAAQLRLVLTLAAVLALDTADKGTIAATALNLQDAFDIGKTQIGLLLTVSGLVGAAATLGFGSLVDRVTRTRLLFAVIVVWGATMLAGAAAPSYGWLLASRVLLGGVTAAAYPAVSSIVGDAFPTADRSRVLGMILAGELVGTGFGVVASGLLASRWSWRAAFALMAVPAVAVAWLVRRTPEPTRGATSRLDPEESSDGPAGHGTSIQSLVARRGIEADPDAVLNADARTVNLVDVLRYVLRVRTNVILIISSALGYYMFAGVRTFGVEFADEHYGVSQSLASALIVIIGATAIVGVVMGGRVADWLVQRGHLDARILVPAAAFVVMTATFAPALFTTSLTIALPLLMSAGFFLAVANPPLDAARLDVLPPRLWGRAEGIRTTLRASLEALAPLVFGAVAEHLFGGQHGSGLQATFLIMLVPLAASTVLLFLARRTYLTDVATATASNVDDVEGSDDASLTPGPQGRRRSPQGALPS